MKIILVHARRCFQPLLEVHPAVGRVVLNAKFVGQCLFRMI